ncbi:MAG TPA: hypothetical protein VLG12_02365 [Candidatus Saccharimonadales bacterium]|nr:hypothetical protein [Candidatus Saccharimonadales bacterium]
MRVQLPPPAHTKNLLPQQFIWSANLAYAVGLLITDGSLSKDGRHIILSSSDIEQLNNFSFCLGITNKISQTYNNGYAIKPHYRIQFGNVQLYRWLVKIGLFPNKTYTIGSIKISKKYFRDLLRGHLDGDGSIVRYIDQYNIYKGKTYINHRLYVKFISASNRHILWLQEKIYKSLEIKGALSYKDRSKPTLLWELKFAKKDSIKLLNWLYYRNDLPCLKRKRALAEEYLV